MVILMAVALCLPRGNAPAADVPSTGAQANDLNLTGQERKALDIALGDETIKKVLSGRKYEIKQVNMQNASASEISFPFEGPFVQFVRLNDDGSVDDNWVVYVDMRNNSVTSILPEKPVAVSTAGPLPMPGKR